MFVFFFSLLCTCHFGKLKSINLSIFKVPYIHVYIIYIYIYIYNICIYIYTYTYYILYIYFEEPCYSLLERKLERKYCERKQLIISSLDILTYELSGIKNI